MDPRTGQPIPSTSAACREQPIIQRASGPNLNDLPIELIVAISKYLEKRDQLVLCFASDRIQDILFPEPFKILKREIIDANVFNMEGFKKIAHLITEIDLFSVTNFDAGSKKAFTLMKNLVNVDLTFTNIYSDEYEALLPNTVQHFTAAVTRKDNVIQANPLAYEYIMNYIKTIPNVHFYIKTEMTDFMFHDLSPTQNIKITSLSSSLVQCYVEMQDKKVPQFRTLQFNLNLSTRTRISLFTGYLDLTQIEFLLYNFDAGHNKPIMFTSLRVSKLLNENKNIFKHIAIESLNAVCESYERLIDLSLRHHIRFLMWNIAAINPDDLCEVIREDIRKNIPSHICAHGNIDVPLLFNEYNDECIITVTRECLEGVRKCDFDFEFVEKYKYKHITLLSGCVCAKDRFRKKLLIEPFVRKIMWSRLKHVTCLNIIGLTLDNMAWKDLFKECPKLTTLVIYNSLMALSANNESIAEHMGLAQNLKHFKLIEKNLALDKILFGAAKCVKLELLTVCSLTMCDLQHPSMHAVNALKAGCPKLAMALLKNYPVTGTIKDYIHLVDEHKFKSVDIMSVSLMDYASILYYPNNILYYDDYDC